MQWNNDSRKRTSIAPGHSRLLAIAVIVFCAAGCQQRTVPTADSNRADRALRQALDVWKNGQSADVLAELEEPIHVSDSEWQSGAELVKYEVTSGQRAGYGWRCDVMLTVKTGRGKPRQHAALYRIDTEPSIVVVHEE